MSALSPARPRLLWPFAGLIVAFAVIAGLLTPMTAQAAPVALAGIVRGENGKTLASVGVTALKVVGGTQTPVATGTTGSGGTFSFPTLTAGTYTLKFTASAVSFAHCTSSWTRCMFQPCEKPQSVPAITRSRPTTLA